MYKHLIVHELHRDLLYSALLNTLMVIRALKKDVEPSELLRDQINNIQ